MQKEFTYKVYTRNDVYLTTWVDVANEVELAQEINLAGAQLQIILPRNAGDYGEGTDIDFGYRVKVYCYDTEEPEGQLLFNGFISSYTPIYSENKVEVTVLSFGEELNRFMLQSPYDLTNSVVAQYGVVRDTGSPSYAPLSTFGDDPAGAGDWFRTGVKFTAPAGMTSLGAIDVTFKPADAAPAVFTDELHHAVKLTVYPLLTSGARSGYPDYGTPLGSVTLPVGTSPSGDLDYAAKSVWFDHTAKVYTFTFTSTIAVTPATSYVFVLEAPDGDYSSTAFGFTVADMWADYYFDTSTVTVDLYSNGNQSSLWPIASGQDLPEAGQSFTPSQTIILDTVSFYMKKQATPTGPLFAKIYAHTGTFGSTGKPTGTALATSVVLDASSLTGSYADTVFTFTGANKIILELGTNYFVVVGFTGGDGSNYVILGDDTSTPSHAGNLAYYGGGAWISDTPDLCFTVNGANITTTARNYYNYERSGAESESYSSTSVIPFAAYSADGSTTVAYSSYDPGAMMRDIMDKYRLQGGTLNYTTDTIELCGTTVTYTFSSNTTLEGISKCVELAPTGWYWYVDYATNLVHFHQQNTTPDHTLSFEKDLQDAKFEKRIEDLINTIYFTGGGDPALYKKFTNSDSVTKYGIKASKYIDQRVTVLATAETIADSILATKSEPELRVTLEVIDSNGNTGLGYDIESIKVGDIVAVRNVSQTVGLSSWDIARWDNDYWDFNIYNLSSLQMVIQRINYKADILTIYASTIAPDVSKRIEDINRNLETLQTLNNPDTPS